MRSFLSSCALIVGFAAFVTGASCGFAHADDAQTIDDCNISSSFSSSLSSGSMAAPKTFQEGMALGRIRNEAAINANISQKAQSFNPELIRNGYCLGTVDEYLQRVAKLRAKISEKYEKVKTKGSGSLVDGILSEVADQVMDYASDLATEVLNQACQYVATNTNNLIDKLCIPTPNLSLPSVDLGIPSTSRDYCNGLSLTKVFGGVAYHPQVIIPAAGLSGPPGVYDDRLAPHRMSRGIVDPITGEVRM